MIKTTYTATPITDLLGVSIAPTGPDSTELPDPAFVAARFKQDGVLLFRGFPFDKDGFVQFSKQVTPSFVDYSGGAYPRESIDGDNTVMSVTGRRQFFPVPLHGEMFYTTVRPTVLWFYCERPPVSRGETTVCDGIQLYDRLGESTRRLFDKKRIKYVRRYPDGDWQKIYQTEDLAEVGRLCQERRTEFFLDSGDGSVVTTFFTMAYTQDIYSGRRAFVNNILPVMVQQSRGHEHSKVFLDDDSPIPDPILREIVETAERLTVEVAWQKGDLVMINNTRCMHGRRLFQDTQREIYVRMAADIFP
jgi:alpha-ketoglutarate-dependent taurine dioxygenase